MKKNKQLSLALIIGIATVVLLIRKNKTEPKIRKY